MSGTPRYGIGRSAHLAGARNSLGIASRAIAHPTKASPLSHLPRRVWHGGAALSLGDGRAAITISEIARHELAALGTARPVGRTAFALLTDRRARIFLCLARGHESTSLGAAVVGSTIAFLSHHSITSSQVGWSYQHSYVSANTLEQEVQAQKYESSKSRYSQHILNETPYQPLLS